MKLTLILFSIVYTAILLAACNKSATTRVDDSLNNHTLTTIVLEVPTVACTGCWPRVEASARSVSGVVAVKFDKNRIQQVMVVYDPAQTSVTAIIAVIEKNGDKVTKLSE